MGGRRDYTRWDYDDETEITMEEQLTLEENGDSGSLGGRGGGGESLSNATFPPPNVMSSSSPIRSRGESSKRSRKTSIKEKAQLFALSAGVLLVGFIVGFSIGVRDRGSGSAISSRHSKHSSSSADTSASSHEHNELILHNLVNQISADNIRQTLRKVTQGEHRAGTSEGRSMAFAIRDLWRSYGISVRAEQHKTLLTKTASFNYVEILEKNGSVSFTTFKTADDMNHPDARPVVAFSPAADVNGTLIYGHYGHLQDFQRLKKSLIVLNGSIALIRFGSLHPSNVATNAKAFGIRGLIFYPDPEDFGPQLPNTAIKRSSLLTAGQVHDFQKHKDNWGIPSHTVSSKDAKRLFGVMNGTEKAPLMWVGGLKTTYFMGSGKPEQGMVHLKTFNEAKTSSIYNVVAAIPGIMESDRYVIIGCSHDSWAGAGAGDPGIGLAMTTEVLRAFSSALASGWRPRRSILFISWDANLHASSGVSHWLQEHHFEIYTRAVAYIDMTRILQGNRSLEVYSSPLLKEVVRKAINRIKHSSGPSSSSSTSFLKEGRTPEGLLPNVQWKSAVSSDEPAFVFLGNLGIPFIRLCVSNTPEEFNYPMYHTTSDTFDNFEGLVDSDYTVSQTLGRIIAEIMVLLSDSSALPITLQDYIREIRKEFDHFMAEYHDDFHKANLSYTSLQAAVMRLEVTADSFKSQNRNHTMGNKDISHSSSIPHKKLRREMHHRIMNDKLISVEKALLLKNSDSNDGYKHQIIGYTKISMVPDSPHLRSSGLPASSAETRGLNGSSGGNKSRATEAAEGKKPTFSSSPASTEPLTSFPVVFSKLRVVLDCGRSCDAGLNQGDVCTDFYLLSTTSQGNSEGLTSESNRTNISSSVRRSRSAGDKSKSSRDPSRSSVSSSSRRPSSQNCGEWRSVASQRISSLVRSLDSVSAIIQSPLVAQPHE